MAFVLSQEGTGSTRKRKAHSVEASLRRMRFDSGSATPSPLASPVRLGAKEAPAETKFTALPPPEVSSAKARGARVARSRFSKDPAFRPKRDVSPSTSVRSDSTTASTRSRSSQSSLSSLSSLSDFPCDEQT